MSFLSFRVAVVCCGWRWCLILLLCSQCQHKLAAVGEEMYSSSKSKKKTIGLPNNVNFKLDEVVATAENEVHSQSEPNFSREGPAPGEALPALAPRYKGSCREWTYAGLYCCCLGGCAGGLSSLCWLQCCSAKVAVITLGASVVSMIFPSFVYCEKWACCGCCGKPGRPCDANGKVCQKGDLCCQYLAQNYFAWVPCTMFPEKPQKLVDDVKYVTDAVPQQRDYLEAL